MKLSRAFKSLYTVVFTGEYTTAFGKELHESRQSSS